MQDGWLCLPTWPQCTATCWGWLQQPSYAPSCINIPCILSNICYWDHIPPTPTFVATFRQACALLTEFSAHFSWVWKWQFWVPIWSCPCMPSEAVNTLQEITKNWWTSQCTIQTSTSGYLSCPAISKNILVWGFLLTVRILEREVRTTFFCPRVTWPNGPGPGLSQTMEQWTGTCAVTWDHWYIWWIAHVPGPFRGVWGLYNMSQGCFSGHFFFPCGGLKGLTPMASGCV